MRISPARHNLVFRTFLWMQIAIDSHALLWGLLQRDKLGAKSANSIHGRLNTFGTPNTFATASAINVHLKKLFHLPHEERQLNEAPGGCPGPVFHLKQRSYISPLQVNQ